MKALIFVVVMILVIGCNRNGKNEKFEGETNESHTLTELEIKELLTKWREDSVGCLRTRDPEKMKVYAKRLIGLDSLELIRQLGEPNYRYGKKGKRNFYYALECLNKGTSYYNFYFHFDKGSIKSFSNPVH